MDDLNNFFAKKDKKKSRVGKFTTANEIDKKLQITDNKRDKYVKQIDNEWNDYEERKKDYTGLKIQNSTVIEQDDETGSPNGLSNLSSPWKELEAKTEEKDDLIQAPEDKIEVVRVPVWKELTNPTVNVYIPPHLRNKTVLSLNRRNPKTKINIEDTNIFPMLTSFMRKRKPLENSGLRGMILDPHTNINNSAHITSGDYFNNSQSYYNNQ